MSKIYNIAFRMGVLFNVLLFIALNLISFVNAHNRFIEGQNGIRFSGWIDYTWGFPIKMFVNLKGSTHDLSANLARTSEVHFG